MHRTRGIAFESESDLRQKGAYKTPDMLLQVPMAVKGPRNEVSASNAMRTDEAITICAIDVSNSNTISTNKDSSAIILYALLRKRSALRTLYALMRSAIRTLLVPGVTVSYILCTR